MNAYDTAQGNAIADTTRFEQRVGHPPGLFLLFFAEMWERFSYYGMRALLVFYMTKGFLGYGDNDAYSVYGAYTSLVYMTPFLGGMLADRVLGPRRAVVIGGLLMAAGHLLMTVEQSTAFFAALALLICGNGFFKPNISTMVGGLYHAHNRGRRDGGFTIFYMGINLGAAMAPLLCGYVGEIYGWHYGFGLATIGMLVGLAVFVAPNRLTQGLIAAGALTAGGGLVAKSMGKDFVVALVNVPIALALLIAAGMAVTALQFGGLPKDAGAPPTRDALNKRQGIVLFGTLLAIPAAATLVQHSTATGYVLSVFGLLAFGYMFVESLRSEKVERQRLWVVLVMFFFSMLFWAFFEQAGSSMNNFADRNVDRVLEQKVVTAADVGQTMPIPVNQEQLGYETSGKTFTIDQLDALRKDWNAKNTPAAERTVAWTLTDQHVGMGIGGTEIPASEFQAANPAYILLFGLLFTLLWAFLMKRNREPSTPTKFALGILQLGLGFGVLWYGAAHHDARGMVGMSWLLLAYLLHTTGEICLSPVGLSMVTKLSPARMVSTAMGGWFLATAFSEYLSGLIAQLTGVGHGAGDEKVIPPPLQTVDVYGDVFGRIGIAAVVAALVLFALTPLLKKWMHAEVPMTGEEQAPNAANT
jgi:POT family proton-dependent oligopeptide transporter